MKKTKRIDLAKRLLAALESGPKSIVELSEILKENKAVLGYLSRKLKDSGFLTVVPNRGGLMTTRQPTEKQLIKALGYEVIPKPFKCDLCEEMKIRIKQKSETSEKVNFVNEKNKRWCGLTCPDCVALDAEIAYGQSLKLHLSKRKCRQCGTYLTVDRYFNCVDCMPNLPTVDEDHIYTSSGSNWGGDGAIETLVDLSDDFGD